MCVSLDVCGSVRGRTDQTPAARTDDERGQGVGAAQADGAGTVRVHDADEAARDLAGEPAVYSLWCGVVCV